MPRTNHSGDSRLSEIKERLTKRYEAKGSSAHDARERAEAEVESRASGIIGAGFGKGLGRKGSSARNIGPSRSMKVRQRSDKEKQQSAARKSSHQKSPGQKRIRGTATKTQS